MRTDLYIPQDFGTGIQVLSPFIHVSKCDQGASNDSAFTSFEKHPYVTDTLPSNALDVKSPKE